MTISPKERFLDICHFKRPGDLFTFDKFWPETLEKWVKRGTPEQVIDPCFIYDYFQFDHWHPLTQVKSGINADDTQSSMAHLYNTITSGGVECQR